MLFVPFFCIRNPISPTSLFKFLTHGILLAPNDQMKRSLAEKISHLHAPILIYLRREDQYENHITTTDDSKPLIYWTLNQALSSRLVTIVNQRQPPTHCLDYWSTLWTASKYYHSEYHWLPTSLLCIHVFSGPPTVYSETWKRMHMLIAKGRESDGPYSAAKVLSTKYYIRDHRNHWFKDLKSQSLLRKLPSSQGVEGDDNGRMRDYLVQPFQENGIILRHMSILPFGIPTYTTFLPPENELWRSGPRGLWEYTLIQESINRVFHFACCWWMMAIT